MRIRRVVPDLHGENPADSREFYEKVLGFDLIMDQGWVATFAAPDNPAAQIMVMREDASAPINPDVSVEVDDVDQAFAAAQEMDCDILYPLTDEPWGVRRFFVREPNGSVLNVLSHH